jgi:hypothetical protein
MPEVIPVALQLYVYAPATEQEYDDGVLWDRAYDALDAAGFVSDGGSARIMEESDVVPDSPLAKALTAARATRCTTADCNAPATTVLRVEDCPGSYAYCAECAEIMLRGGTAETAPSAPRERKQ